jgi:hypothetical protein
MKGRSARENVKSLLLGAPVYVLIGATHLSVGLFKKQYPYLLVVGTGTGLYLREIIS